jgi:hypothetical protein
MIEQNWQKSSQPSIDSARSAIWPEVGTGGSTPRFDGFHLASTPRVLRDA